MLGENGIRKGKRIVRRIGRTPVLKSTPEGTKYLDRRCAVVGPQRLNCHTGQFHLSRCNKCRLHCVLSVQSVFPLLTVRQVGDGYRHLPVFETGTLSSVQ